jgi:hypothetical protein
MTSTTITRSCRRLAVCALLVGIAFGAHPIAGADPPAFDQAGYDRCIAGIGADDTDWIYKSHACCQEAGGVPTQIDEDTIACSAPPATDEGNAPGKPGVTVPRVPDVGASNPPAPTKPGVNVPIVPGNSVG